MDEYSTNTVGWRLNHCWRVWEIKDKFCLNLVVFIRFSFQIHPACKYTHPSASPLSSRLLLKIFYSSSLLPSWANILLFFFERNLTLDTNYNFPILTSLQPDRVNIWLVDPVELIFWNIKDLRHPLHRYAYSYDKIRKSEFVTSVQFLLFILVPSIFTYSCPLLNLFSIPFPFLKGCVPSRK